MMNECKEIVVCGIVHDPKYRLDWTITCPIFGDLSAQTGHKPHTNGNYWVKRMTPN
jgi:hypothetical protein